MSDVDIQMKQTAAASRRVPSRSADVIFGGFARLAALVTLLLLGGIIASLIYSSWPTINKLGLGFLWHKEWDPPADHYGALVPIYGTLVTSFIALAIAVPVSFGIALFLTELSPAWLRRPLGTAIELLAAIPSIVYGMWGLLVFSPIFADWFEKTAWFRTRFDADYRCLVQRAADRYRLALRRGDSGDHDYSLRRVGDARCV